MATLSRFRMSLLTVALLATAPAFAQKVSLADRVSRLEQQSASQGSTAGQANVELLNRLTQMQSEVQALRNQLEQLQNENEQLKQRNREQYVDLDSRLQRMEGGAIAPAAGATPTSAARPGAIAATRPGSVSAPPAARPVDPATGAAPPAAGEQAAYSTAFAALRSGNYVESARGFQAYLRDYPSGALAPNAWYWLGESYYVTQNFPVALKSFESLLSQFPDSAKAPDALLKRGYCQIELDQVGPGSQTLNRVINEYPGTDAARLAASRLRALSVEAR